MVAADGAVTASPSDHEDPAPSVKTRRVRVLILWGCSAVLVYPGRLIAEIDAQRKDKDRTTHPAILGRSISFAPTLLWVDWQEGDQAFNCAGFQGIFVATPFGTKLLWKRCAWVS